VQKLSNIHVFKWYRYLLGLGNEKPFECVGNKEEVYVAFELCKRKGIKGKAMDIYENELNGLDFKSILDKCFSINKDQHNLPQNLAVSLFKALNDTLVLKKKTSAKLF
jgi:hypothetical protein